MATKDWKKRRYGIEWDNAKLNQNIRILSPKESLERSWVVHIINFESIGKSSYNKEIYHRRRMFKTKSQALKYARDYMRKH